MSTTASIPDEYVCPISYEVMEDPVILEDGHTYDRKGIESWLASYNRSPMTNRTLASKALRPNYAIRSAIERWRATEVVAAVATPVAATPVIPLFSHAGSSDWAGLSAVADATPLPTAVIAILDRSGSMSESAAAASQHGSEAGLFSRMDLVKHSMRTVTGLLASRSASLGIISFSDDAETNLPIKTMDAVGKGDAERAIEALYPGGGTNIWAGLRAGLDAAAAWGVAHPGSNVHVILLTDGEPTKDYLPLQGIPTALKKKLATLKARVTLSCFGFGYNLDTKLLEAICVEGGGTYGYIPDCTMVGTIFINYCAAALTTVAAHLGGVEAAIHAGQRVFVGATVTPATAVTKPADPLTSEEEVQARRIVQLRAALAVATRSKQLVSIDASGLRALAEELLGLDEAERTPFEAALLDDLDHTDDYKGQLLKAVSSEKYFMSWGLNYLLSYSRALACQQCVNFKDGALQFFGSASFKAIQEEGNDIFDNLPVPAPSCGSVRWGGGGGAISTISMATFNMAGGSCWDQWTPIRMEDGWTKYAKEVVAGEKVWGGHTIRAVVKTIVAGRTPMIRLAPGILITPWHPVRRGPNGGVAGSWQFPAEVEGAPPPRDELINYHYNLVLETGHVVQLGGGSAGSWEACTLGHGFTDGHVITHPYFGTDAVIKDLQAMRGWEEGIVVPRVARIQRDPATGLVNGFAGK